MRLSRIPKKKSLVKEVSSDPLAVDAEQENPPPKPPKKIFKIIKNKLLFKIRKVKHEKKKKKTLRLKPESTRTRRRPQSSVTPGRRRSARKPMDKAKKIGTLICLDNYGKGEAIRMLLWHSQLDYDTVVVTPEQVK